MRLAGAEPVVLPTREEDGFVPRAKTLERALAEGPLKAVILNTPCNPTGAVIPAEEVRLLADLAHHDLLLISDETYEFFHYGSEPFASFAPHAPRMRENLVLVGSFSKSYAMTGWRVGYALELPQPHRGHGQDPVPRCQPHRLVRHEGCGSGAADRALGSRIDAGRASQAPRSDGGGTLQIPSALRASAGAYYVLPNMRGLMERFSLATSSDLARAMLLSLGIAAVPGSAVRHGRYLRLSYAVAMDRIEEGLLRLEQCRGSGSRTGAHDQRTAEAREEQPRFLHRRARGRAPLIASPRFRGHRPGGTAGRRPRALRSHSAHHRRVRRGGPEDRRAAGRLPGHPGAGHSGGQEQHAGHRPCHHALVPVPVVVYVAGAHAASAGFYITLSADGARNPLRSGPSGRTRGLGTEGRGEKSS